MVTYTLTNAVNVGSLNAPVVVSTLNVTGVEFSTTPALAPIGTAELSITLTDPVSGWQETLDYRDSSVITFFNQTAPAPPSGATMADVMATAIFDKLIADGKLPAGTISTE